MLQEVAQQQEAQDPQTHLDREAQQHIKQGQVNEPLSDNNGEEGRRDPACRAGASAGGATASGLSWLIFKPPLGLTTNRNLVVHLLPLVRQQVQRLALYG